MVFVDTNYFLRFFVKDNKEQFKAAESLFLEGARGNLTLITSTAVLFEIYWVLKTYYQKNKIEIVKILQSILNMTFIRIEERNLLTQTIYFYKESNLSLEDCYNLHYAKDKNVDFFKTFDAKLAKTFTSTAKA